MLAVVDCRLPVSAEESLLALGCKILKLPPHPMLAEPVASHPDMLLFFARDAFFCTKSYQKIAGRELRMLQALSQKTMRTVEEELGSDYPQDVLLNAAPVGDHLFCLPSHTATAIKGSGFQTVPVKQGYAKCSVLPIGKKALITEDPSIARSASSNGFDVLQVSGGAVSLKGYDTGFLGGASSFAPYGEMTRILFCGRLDTHPDADQICFFCKEKGFEAISLGDTPITDVGTIFLIPERS